MTTGTDTYRLRGAGRRAARAVRAAGRALLLAVAGRDRPVSWPRRWLRWVVTAAMVPAGYAAFMLTVLGLPQRLGVARPALALLVALPVLLVIRYPLMAWRVGWLAALIAPPLTHATGWPWGSWPWSPAQIPILLAVCAVAGLRSPRPALWGMCALMVPVAWLSAGHLDNAVSMTLLLAVFAVLVDSVGGRLRAQRALHAESERTELERARRAVLEERTRIAREMHDVVAHHMSLIAVQAETAPYRRDDLTAGATEELGSIGAQARQALAEMRRLLGVLRSDPSAERAPQPGLAELPELVASADRAGVRVSLADIPDGAVPEIPETVQVCAYRITQEALSNVARHAPGAAVTVSLDRKPDRLRLRIENGRGDRPARAVAGGGHGLVGMRERATLLGGTLVAGGTPAGGFAVTAELPYSGGEPAADRVPG